MKNFVEPGDVITLTAPAGGVVSGNPYKIGAFTGVAAYSAPAGAQFEMKLGGVYDFPKTSAEAWAEGDVIYMTSGGIMTTVLTSNTKVGVAAKAAANPSGIGRVRMNNSF